MGKEAFAQAAALANMFEIEAAKLAIERDKDEPAEQFARDMVLDHTKVGASWRDKHAPERYDTTSHVARSYADRLSGRGRQNLAGRYLEGKRQTLAIAS